MWGSYCSASLAFPSRDCENNGDRGRYEKDDEGAGGEGLCTLGAGTGGCVGWGRGRSTNSWRFGGGDIAACSGGGDHLGGGSARVVGMLVGATIRGVWVVEWDGDADVDDGDGGPDVVAIGGDVAPEEGRADVCWYSEDHRPKASYIGSFCCSCR